MKPTIQKKRLPSSIRKVSTAGKLMIVWWMISPIFVFSLKKFNPILHNSNEFAFKRFDFIVFIFIYISFLTFIMFDIDRVKDIINIL